MFAVSTAKSVSVIWLRAEEMFSKDTPRFDTLVSMMVLEPDCTFANISKIGTRLGWKPAVSFEDGVGRMLVDIERWRDAPLWDPDGIAEATKTWFRYLGKQRA